MSISFFNVLEVKTFQNSYQWIISQFEQWLPQTRMCLLFMGTYLFWPIIFNLFFLKIIKLHEIVKCLSHRDFRIQNCIHTELYNQPQVHPKFHDSHILQWWFFSDILLFLGQKLSCWGKGSAHLFLIKRWQQLLRPLSTFLYKDSRDHVIFSSFELLQNHSEGRVFSQVARDSLSRVSHPSPERKP